MRKTLNDILSANKTTVHHEGVNQLFEKKSTTANVQSLAINSEIQKMKYLMMALFFLTLVGILITFIRTNKGVTEIPPTPAVQKEDSQFFTSAKYVNLRTAPSTKSSIIKTLSPNHRLKLIDSKGNWVKITYRDYLNNRLLTGWLYNQNLKKLDI